MFLAFILLIPLALALPQAPAPQPIPSRAPMPQPAPNPSPSVVADPAMSISIQTFHAYVVPEGSKDANWTEFLVSSTSTTPVNQSDPSPSPLPTIQDNGFICNFTVHGPLYNPNDWHDCVQKRGSGMDMSFRIDDGFERMWVKKGWVGGDGTYLIGIASQPCFWDYEEGGNVTTMGFGDYYERIEEWRFGIESISG